jgi:uncharacterized protein DUF4129
VRARAVDPDAARRDAQHILSDGRFRSRSTPRPLRGPLQWMGKRLDSTFSPVGRFLGGLPAIVWYAVLVAVIVGIALLINRSLRRRGVSAPSGGRAARRAAEAGEAPDELERAADAAERDGDLDRAVRLRFRAGLLRLGDRGAIRYRPSVTTTEVRRTLASPRFDDLAGTFEAVTYGGRPADPPDVAAARREWPHVLEETAPR